MAAKKEAKVTKVTAKKATAKTDYSAMSSNDLQKALADKHQDLVETKRNHRSGELVNPRVLATIRKEIARIMTALNATKGAN